jgi:hypothetical protein
MSSLQRRIAVVIDTNANLITQLSELDLLREQVRKAEKCFIIWPNKNYVTRIFLRNRCPSPLKMADAGPTLEHLFFHPVICGT